MVKSKDFTIAFMIMGDAYPSCLFHWTPMTADKELTAEAYTISILYSIRAMFQFYSTLSYTTKV